MRQKLRTGWICIPFLIHSYFPSVASGTTLTKEEMRNSKTDLPNHTHNFHVKGNESRLGVAVDVADWKTGGEMDIIHNYSVDEREEDKERLGFWCCYISLPIFVISLSSCCCYCWVRIICCYKYPADELHEDGLHPFSNGPPIPTRQLSSQTTSILIQENLI